MTFHPASGHGGVDFDVDLDWPAVAFDADAVRVINRRGRVMIVHGQLRVGQTADADLAAILKVWPSDLDRAAVISLGRVRTLKEGVERVVRNIITHPHVEAVVLIGRDSRVFRPLRGLASLHAYGRDDAGHICPGPSPDPAVARVLARDALVNLSAGEVDYFRIGAGVRVIDDLIDGPSEAGEALRAAARIMATLTGSPPRTPRYDFASLFDVRAWRGGRTVAAGAAPKTLAAAAPFTWQLIDDPHQPERVAVRITRAAPAAQVVLTIPATANLASEKLLHTWLVWAREHGGPPTEWDTCQAAITLESLMLARQAAHELAAPRPHQAGSSPVVQPQPGLADETLPTAGIEARLTAFDDDPAGWLVTRVDHERGTILTDVFANATPGDNATGRLAVTVTGDDPYAIMATLLGIADGDIAGSPLPGGREVFGHHGQRLEHIGYVALMVRRAAAALATGRGFSQDRPLDVHTVRNIDDYAHTPWGIDQAPRAGRLNAAVVVTAPTLAGAWHAGLASLRDDGLVTVTQKGRVVENWATVFHIADMAALTLPAGYPSSEANIAAYAAEFRAPRPSDSDHEYTYGDRMCHHFGHDQIAAISARLAAHPGRVACGQRFHPHGDLGRRHVPCLAFDAWWLWGGRLHTLQVARSHDIYGAMPQNALGVVRGWAAPIAAHLGCPLGDLLFVSLSNNYRVADNAAAVARVLESSPLPHDVALRDQGRGRPHPALTLSPVAALTDVEDRLDNAVASPVRIAYWLDGPPDSVLDGPTLAAAAAGHTPITRRLRTHGGVDQLAVFAEHLRAELAADNRYRSQHGLLSPRDPHHDGRWPDNPHEPYSLLCVQFRNQLGRLHAAAVFTDPTAPLASRLAEVVALQRQAAAMVGCPTGSVFILEVGPVAV